MSGGGAGIPRLYAAASLKPLTLGDRLAARPRRIPRLYAAASLKPLEPLLAPLPTLGIPRLYAAASLKREEQFRRGVRVRGVFRGSMPRPH